jgi:hypothetical protein
LWVVSMFESITMILDLNTWKWYKSVKLTIIAFKSWIDVLIQIQIVNLQDILYLSCCYATKYGSGNGVLYLNSNTYWLSDFLQYLSICSWVRCTIRFWFPAFLYFFRLLKTVQSIKLRLFKSIMDSFVEKKLDEWNLSCLTNVFEGKFMLLTMYCFILKFFLLFKRR